VFVQKVNAPQNDIMLDDSHQYPVNMVQ